MLVVEADLSLSNHFKCQSKRAVETKTIPPTLRNVSPANAPSTKTMLSKVKEEAGRNHKLPNYLQCSGIIWAPLSSGTREIPTKALRYFLTTILD